MPFTKRVVHATLKEFDDGYAVVWVEPSTFITDDPNDPPRYRVQVGMQNTKPGFSSNFHTRFIEDEEPENPATINLYEKITEKLEILTKGLFIGYLNDLIDEIEQSRESVLEAKGYKALEQYLKTKVFLKGLDSIASVAADQFDLGEYNPAHRIYIGIMELLDGGGFLYQHLYQEIEAMTEEKGIELTSSQIERAIESVTNWIQSGLEDSIDAAVNLVNPTGGQKTFRKGREIYAIGEKHPTSFGSVTVLEISEKVVMVEVNNTQIETPEITRYAVAKDLFEHANFAWKELWSYQRQSVKVRKI